MCEAKHREGFSLAGFDEEKEEAEAVVTELKAREDDIAEAQKEAVMKAPMVTNTTTTVNGAAPQGTADAANTSTSTTATAESRLVMTPQQFEQLLQRVMQNAGTGPQPLFDPYTQQYYYPSVNGGIGMNPDGTMSNGRETEEMKQLRERTERIERMLQTMDARSRGDSLMLEMLENQEDIKANRSEVEREARMLKELRAIREELKEVKDKMGENKEVEVEVIVEDEGRSRYNGANRIGGVGTPRINRSGNFLAQDTSTFRGRVQYTGLSGMAGFTFTEESSISIGLRWHYNTGVGTLQFMPEVFFGFSDPATFGITANVIQPIRLGRIKAFQPYIGAGFGFQQLPDEDATEADLSGGFNLIGGTYLNVGGGRLYVEFNGRELLDHQQLLAGYRFSF